MDAKVGDGVVTPRIGKPVEVQALWINALRLRASLDAAFAPLRARARAAFFEALLERRRGYLTDVVDVDHRAGVVDA